MKFKIADELLYMLHLPIRKETHSLSQRVGEGEAGKLNANVSCNQTQGVSLWREEKKIYVCLDF